MARIVVYTMAYRGDVHPYVPVATELVRRGHHVTFVVPREFHNELAAEPFTCVHSGSDFGPTELNKHGEWVGKWGMRLGGVRLLKLYYGELTVPHLDAMFEALHDACAGADLVFCHPATAPITEAVAETRDVPWISGDLFPMLVPTSTRSCAPNLPSMGPPINRFGWKMASSPRPYRMTFATDFARFRQRHGLPDNLRSPLTMRLSPHLNLGLVSPHYVPPAPDWPTNYVMTGFTHWANAEGEMPDGLTEFLSADDAPLLITLGTLGAASHPERFEAAISAADQLGLRTVSLCSLPDTVAQLADRFDRKRHGAWAFAPLSKVLPAVRGVVHSGAHGTNSMTLAAGLPSVIIPSIFDQAWHAKRQVELGTGVYAKRPRDLPAALARLATDPALTAKARHLAGLLAVESGTAATADHIEAFLAR